MCVCVCVCVFQDLFFPFFVLEEQLSYNIIKHEAGSDSDWMISALHFDVIFPCLVGLGFERPCGFHFRDNMNIKCPDVHLINL